MNKERITAFITAAAALLAIVTSGCSGQSISQTQETTDNAQTTTVVCTTSKTTTETTLARTVPPALTSCTTVTTRENNQSVVENLLAGMTLEDKIYQMFIVTPEGLTNFSGSVTEAGSLTKNALENKPVGGLIYFSQNLQNWYQTYNMLYNSQEWCQEAHNEIGLFLAVDEEGGSVARVAEKLGTYRSYSIEKYGQMGSTETVYKLGNTIGLSLSELGFNLNLAPVADVDINPDNELGDRIFSSDPYEVSDMVSNYVKGVRNTGVAATLKHFPGLGAGSGDTHKGSVVIDRTLGDLWENEFIAFRGGIEAGADCIMVGHQITTSAGDNLPADLSYTVVTEWLKTSMGYDGIIISDSHSMGAITDNYSPGEAAVLSIQAGVDMILMPYDLNNAVSGVRNAVADGEITEERLNESVRKILTKKYEMGIIDIVIKETTTSTTND